jgi:hypothetical protein
MPYDALDYRNWNLWILVVSYWFLTKERCEDKETSILVCHTVGLAGLAKKYSVWLICMNWKGFGNCNKGTAQRPNFVAAIKHFLHWWQNMFWWEIIKLEKSTTTVFWIGVSLLYIYYVWCNFKPSDLDVLPAFACVHNILSEKLFCNRFEHFSFYFLVSENSCKHNIKLIFLDNKYKITWKSWAVSHFSSLWVLVVTIVCCIFLSDWKDKNSTV